MIKNRREHFRFGLNELYLPVYDALCRTLPDEWQPYYGIRTFEEQARLYAQGRTAPGRIVTNARPGESAHNYGCASDWTMWKDGRPLWIQANDPRIKVFQDAVRQASGRWGGDWDNDGNIFEHSFIDVPHVELMLAISWGNLRNTYLNHGPDATDRIIRANMLGAA